MLYKLNNDKKGDYKKVDRVTLKDAGWTEKDLENLISKHITDLISTNDLMTIFTERPLQEEPDILAIDSKGELYIFELKAWQAKSENLLQVLRYGQLYGNSNYDDLQALYCKKNKNRNLQEEHKRYFKKDSMLETNDFNRKQHFLVVTNGLDQKTIESIIYWKKNGLQIDGIIYWIFKIENDYYIEFNMYSPIENQLEYESNYYVLNTNYSNNQKSHEEMILEKKASAYCTGWKEKIEKLQKDDLVFLYKTGTGIIAYGFADGKLKKKEWDGVIDDEYYMQLDNFEILKKPLDAATMKLVAKKGFSFRSTMFSIDEESKDLIMDEIRNNYL